jgi:hypothetical protein
MQQTRDTIRNVHTLTIPSGDSDRGAGGEDQGWRRGGGRDDSTAYGGGRRGPAPAAAAPRKKLEITEELTDQLVALKGGDKDYWLLNSALAKLVDKNLTQIVDALVGVPIVDYISSVWATSLAVTVLAHSAQVCAQSSSVVVLVQGCSNVRDTTHAGREARRGAEEGRGVARGGDQEVLPRQQGQVAR